MKLLFITANKNFLTPTSEERKWLNALGQLSATLHVIVLTSRDPHKFSLGNFLRWFLYSGKSLWSDNPHGLVEKVNDHTWIYATDSLLPFFRTYKAYDIIKAHLMWQKRPQVTTVLSDDPFESGSVGLNLAKKYRLNWLIKIEKDFWIKKGNPMPLSDIFDHAKKIGVLSMHAESRIRKVAGNAHNLSKIILLPPTLDVQSAEHATVSSDLKKVYPQFNYIILMATALEEDQRLDLALITLAMIRARYPLAGLVIVGNGSRKAALEAKARSLHISNAVIFEEEQRDLVSYMKTANAYFSLASSDEDDKTLIMAASAGCPIVAAKTPFSESLIKNDENGLLIPELKPGSIFATLIRLNETPGLRERLKINSSMYARDTYVKTPEQYIDKLKEFLTDAESEEEKKNPAVPEGATGSMNGTVAVEK